jgi:hypothetical protein
MKLGLQSYLRNLAIRLSRVAARCPDTKTTSEILKIGDELADKLEALDKCSQGEAFKLNDADVRRAQKMAWYYRTRCKRPITILIA